MRPQWPIFNRKASGYLVYCDDELLTLEPVKRDQAEHLERSLQDAGHVARILSVHTFNFASLKAERKS